MWTSLVIQGLRICLNNAGDSGLIPGQKIKIPLAVGQLSACAATTEPVCCNQSPCTKMKDSTWWMKAPHATAENWLSQINKKEIKYFFKFHWLPEWMLLVLLLDTLFNHEDPSPDAMLVANRPLSSEPCPQTKRSCLAQEVTHLHWGVTHWIISPPMTDWHGRTEVQSFALR